MSEGGRVTEVRSACEIGRDWFLARGAGADAVEATVDGLPVTSGEAIGRAVSVLAGSKAPVVWGLTRTATETVRDTLGLADSLGARVVLDRTPLDLGRVAAFQDQGRVSATLGEVKNRADLVVFWNVDPLKTHPRHWERTPWSRRGGLSPRAVPAVPLWSSIGSRPSRPRGPTSSSRSHPVGRSNRSWCCGRCSGVTGFSNRRTHRSGRAWRSWSALMKAARFGALFFQGSEESGGRSGVGWAEASRLVRDLNEGRRFVLMGMGAPGNPAGAESALTWQGGFLQGVDYRLGRPSGLDEVATIEEVLSAGKPTPSWRSRKDSLRGCRTRPGPGSGRSRR